MPPRLTEAIAREQWPRDSCAAIAAKRRMGTRSRSHIHSKTASGSMGQHGLGLSADVGYRLVSCPLGFISTHLCLYVVVQPEL